MIMSQPTNAHDVELEATFEELPLDLRRDTVETNMAMGENRGGRGRSRARCSSHRGAQESVP